MRLGPLPTATSSGGSSGSPVGGGYTARWGGRDAVGRAEADPAGSWSRMAAGVRPRKDATAATLRPASHGLGVARGVAPPAGEKRELEKEGSGVRRRRGEERWRAAAGRQPAA